MKVLLLFWSLIIYFSQVAYSAPTISSLFGETVGFWTTAEELSTIPTTGCGWDHIVEAADSADPMAASVENQDSNTNVQIMAAAIVFARTQNNTFRTKVVQAIENLVANGQPLQSSTLAWAREVGAYVIAADIVGYRDDGFDEWLLNLTDNWRGSDNRTLLEMFYKRPNNWGSHAFASLAAIYSYSGNTAKLDEIRSYWIKCITGPKPDDLTYGSDLTWHNDINDLRMINPLDSVKDGLNIDGIIPDDMRRGNSFSTTPASTGYPWEFLQGQIVAARILERMDMPIWNVGDNAIARAVYALQVRLDTEFGGWAASGDDEWLLPFIDEAYQTDYSADYDICNDRIYKHGKNAGWPLVLLGDGKTMSSSSPSISPTAVSVVCEDDPSFSFRLFNGQTKKCGWLTKNENRAKKRISKYCKKVDVRIGCEATCGTCFEATNPSAAPAISPTNNCSDDPNFSFQLDNENIQDCSWFTNNTSKITNRRLKYCLGDGIYVTKDDVTNACPKACGLC